MPDIFDKPVFDVPRIAIVMTCFCRPRLLRYSLSAFLVHPIPKGLFIVVVNDGDPKDSTASICDEFSNQLDIRYFSTRATFKSPILEWRTPALTFNFGFKKALDADIIIKSSAEIFPLNDCIRYLSDAVVENPLVVAIPNGPESPLYEKGFDDGGILAYLDAGNVDIPFSLIRKRSKPLHSRLGFMLALRREVIEHLRGYDEDFTSGGGFAYEDGDFRNRLMRYGCVFTYTKANIVHLYHKPIYMNSPDFSRKYARNGQLCEENKTRSVIRNLGHTWGVL